MVPMLRNILVTLSLLASLSSQAKTFRSDFVKLELPPNWDCKKEELDWVCQPDQVSEQSEAILIVVVKPKNETDDTLEKYKEVLAAPRQMRDLVGGAYRAEIKYTKEKVIAGHKWMDSLQKGSEISGFYTRYVATTENKIAALVTYSIAESVFAKWGQVMDQTMDSMTISFNPEAYQEALSARPGSLLGQRLTKNLRLAPKLEDVPKSGGDTKTDYGPIAFGIFAVAAIGYIIWKRKQGQR
jgi:hypothetical protein